MPEFVKACCPPLPPSYSWMSYHKSFSSSSSSSSCSSISFATEVVSASQGANASQSITIPKGLNAFKAHHGHRTYPTAAHRPYPIQAHYLWSHISPHGTTCPDLSAHSHLPVRSAPPTRVGKMWNNQGRRGNRLQCQALQSSSLYGHSQSYCLSAPRLEKHPPLAPSLPSSAVPKQPRFLSRSDLQLNGQVKCTASKVSFGRTKQALTSTFVGQPMVCSDSGSPSWARNLLGVTSMASLSGAGSFGSWPHDRSGGHGSFPMPNETQHLIPSTGSDSDMAHSRDLEPGGQRREAQKQERRRLIAGIDQSELFQPVDLAGTDSRFVDFLGVQIHYKIVCPHGEGDVSLSGHAREPLPSSLTISWLDEKPVHSRDSGKQEERQRDISSRADLGKKELVAPAESEATGPVVPAVLLHGFGASVYSWQKVLDPIAQVTKAPALAFDRPAFGLTERLFPQRRMDSADDLSANPYTTAFSAAATVAFVSNLLMAPKSVLIAHSAGSLVALEAYFRAPELFAAIVLVAPAILITGLSRGRKHPAAAASASPPAHTYAESSRQHGTKGEVHSSGTTTSRGALTTALGCVTISGIGLSSDPSPGSCSGSDPTPGTSADPHLNQASGNIADGVIGGGNVANGTYGTNTEREPRARRGQVKRWFHMMMVCMNAVRTVLSTLCQWIRGSLSQVFTRLLVGILQSAFGFWLARTAVNCFGDYAVRRAWHNVNACDEDVLANYKKPLKCQGWDRGLIEFAAAMASEKQEFPLSRRLGDIKCPVLVMSGDDDRIVPEWNSRRVAGAIPFADYQILADCGHCPQEEKPLEFVSLVQAFLREKLSMEPGNFGDEQQHLDAAQLSCT